MKYFALVLISLGLIYPAEARQRQHAVALANGCNVLWPCEIPYASSVQKTRETRGKYIARQLGIGAPRIQPRKEAMPHTQRIDDRPRSWPQKVAATIVEHPAGRPRSAFCACGAAVRLLGSAHAAPWLARAWYAFKRTVAAPHMAGVRPHHVIALEYQVSGNMWMVYDANSGGRATRLHVIDISPYTIVNPRS